MPVAFTKRKLEGMASGSCLRLWGRVSWSLIMFSVGLRVMGMRLLKLLNLMLSLRF